MKKVFIRVNKSVSVDDAVAHLESLGYKNIWSCGFTPEGMADSLCGKRIRPTLMLLAYNLLQV